MNLDVNWERTGKEETKGQRRQPSRTCQLSVFLVTVNGEETGSWRGNREHDNIFQKENQN